MQRLIGNNFKFTESDRIKENREAVKRDNNNIFDFMESSLAPLKARSFSDAMVANAKKFNLEHCNNITNSAGRRVWGFLGVEAVARNNNYY